MKTKTQNIAIKNAFRRTDKLLLTAHDGEHIGRMASWKLNHQCLLAMASKKCGLPQ